MAVSVSRRVFRSFGSLYGHHRFDYQRIPFCATDALYCHDSSDSASSVEIFNFGKNSLLSCLKTGFNLLSLVYKENIGESHFKDSDQD
ncbi:hypothetical protein RHSIM_Rhsim04G0075200 [Rhododendron simsii]|uniref:Uncharacterized protein n=1 Tax=Rhododendron simsii TaxID=118357 RepID=A0A834H337_RHOSS|nr:hypothetical protein RHSIM_Rhsim04G0075200 [Rhododendron simsii]